MRTRLARSALERSALAYGLIGIAALAVVATTVTVVRGDPFVAALPTLILFGVFAFSWFTGKFGIVSLAWLAVIVAMIGGTALDDRVTRVASYVAMAALSSVLATFARRHPKRVVVAVSVVAASAPLIWERSPVLSMVIACSCAISGLLVAGLRDAIESALARSQKVLEYAPVPIMEQDWSAVHASMIELRRSGVENLGDYIDANPESVSRILGQVRLRFANQATVEFYKAPSKDAVFERFNALEDGGRSPAVNARSFEQYRALLLDLWSGVIGQDAEVPSFDMQGREVWGRVRSYGDPDDATGRIVAVADITQLKRTQADLEESIRSKDRFVASVSHELRTPMAAVVGFANELVDDPDSFTDDLRQDLLRTIRDEAEEVANIIEDLLVVARADMGGITVMHQAVTIDAELPRLLNDRAPSFVVQLPDDPVVVCGDAIRFRQVLRNLITNACRYGGDNRAIRVSVAEDSAIVEVADDGTSLSDEDLSRVFEAYTRAHSTMGTTESVGLGLTVSQLLAQLMSGSLTAYRNDAETVFRLELPLWGACRWASSAPVDEAAASS